MTAAVPDPGATRRRARTVWIALLASVLVWLVVIRLADEGRVPLPVVEGPASLPYLLLGVAVMDVVAGLLVRAAVLRARIVTERPQRALTATTVAASLAASAAVLGFVAFLVTHRAGDFYAFLAVALAGLAASYPRRAIWPA